jgi:hypothetical protein
VATLVKAEKCDEFITNQPLAPVTNEQTAINSEAQTDQLF